jgi:hypothetical protein
MILKKVYLPEPPSIGRTMNVKPRRRKKRKGGGFSWSTYWATRNPYVALPATGVSLMVGQEVTIYGDTLINVPIGNPLSVTYTCDIGTQVGNNLVITPVAGDIGSHSLRMVFKNGSYTIEDETITLEVLAEAPLGTKGIMLIGDSLIRSGADENAATIDAALSECTFTYLGTEGTTVKFEWVGTWANASENTIPTSMFVKNEVLDIAAYFTDNSIATPDYVLIRLGINDTFSQCAISGNGLTDAEIVAILNDAKIFIDAFLAFDANLKIILGLPTLCDKDGVGWDIDYDTSVHSEDMYIENMHKYWVALVDEFEAGAYDARVDVSYEVIHLDRANYPTSSVHPSNAGYTQLGFGMAFKINELLKADLKPTGLTVVWEEDYAKIDFTDATGGVAQHEIWSSKNGEAYILVTTLAAGTVTYNDATWQNASMNYCVRAKSGVWYSDYTAVVNIVTPLVLKTNQTTLTNVVISTLTIAAGKTINIDWGDSTDNDYTGTNSNVTKGYGEGNEANPYYIKISGDTNDIQVILLPYGTSDLWYGDITKWIIPSGIVQFGVRYHSITGDITDKTWGSSCTKIEMQSIVASKGFTGNIGGWQLPAGLTELNLPCATDGLRLDADISALVLPASIVRFYADKQYFTKLPRALGYKNLDSSIGYYVRNCNASIAEIDSFLADVATYFATNTPIKNSLFQLNGTRMGIPSATGLAAKAAIEAAYTAAGFTATIIVNS